MIKEGRRDGGRSAALEGRDKDRRELPEDRQQSAEDRKKTSDFGLVNSE
jgi:hypothetical protein